MTQFNLVCEIHTGNFLFWPNSVSSCRMLQWGHNVVLTRLEVREGSDFPRFRERIRTRLEISDGGCHPGCVCWLVGNRRYFPAEQQQEEVQIDLEKY